MYPKYTLSDTTLTLFYNENDHYVKYKTWAIEQVNNKNLFFHENPESPGHSIYMFRKIDARNSDNYTADSMRAVLIHNTFYDRGENIFKQGWTKPSSIHFLNDSIYIEVNPYKDFSTKDWRSSNDYQYGRRHPYIVTGSYGVDDTLVKGEVFLILNNHKPFQLGEVSSDTITGYVSNLKLDTLHLVKSNFEEPEINFDGIWELEEDIELSRGYANCLGNNEHIELSNDTIKVSLANNEEYIYHSKYLSNGVWHLNRLGGRNQHIHFGAKNC